jgi:type II secretory pathway pseudopilin PulG
VSIATYVIAVLAALLAAFFFGYYQGSLAIEVKDQKAVIKQQSQEQVQAHADATAISTEAKDYAHAVSQAINEPNPAPAVVCVRKYTAPRQLSSAAAPGSVPDADGGLPAAAGGSVQPVTDISKPATVIGATANAQVAGLKDYITRVCLAKR